MISESFCKAAESSFLHNASCTQIWFIKQKQYFQQCHTRYVFVMDRNLNPSMSPSYVLWQRFVPIEMIQYDIHLQFKSVTYWVLW